MNRITDRNKEIPLPCPENADYWRRCHCRLAELEDAEEQRKKLRKALNLPFDIKFGDTVYIQKFLGKKESLLKKKRSKADD